MAAIITKSKEKQVMIVGIDGSYISFNALKWALDRFIVPFGSNSPFKLVIVHAKSSPATATGLFGPGAAEVFTHVVADIKRKAARVVDKAKEMCINNKVDDFVMEVCEGDARNVLCNAVDKHHAVMLVVGGHGYGAIKRAVLGSVTDYCAHHAHCSVTIVKKTNEDYEF